MILSLIKDKIIFEKMTFKNLGQKKTALNKQDGIKIGIKIIF